jgi:hypothetical protein
MRALVSALVLLPLTALAQPAPIAPAPAAPAAPAAPVVAPAAPVVAPAAPVIVPAAPVIVPAAPAVAPAAPAVEPSECVTTTTVRCTGAAAPYAVQAAPTVVVPANPPAAPAPAPAPTLLLDPQALGGGWTLVQTPDGRIWRERKTGGDTPGLWGAGLAFWLGTYGIGVFGSIAAGDGSILFSTVPILGAFLNAGITARSDTARTLWALDGVVQVGGFVAFLVGACVGPTKVQRVPLTIAPTSLVGGGQGVALQGRF